MSERKVVSNVVYMFFQALVATALGYAFWFLSSKMLSPEEVGKFSSILSVSLIVSTLLLLGFPQAAVKLVSKYRGRKKAWEVIFTILLFSTFLNIIFISVSVLSGNPFLILVSVMVLSITFLYLSASFLQGLEHMRHIFFTVFLISVVKLVLAFFGIVFGLGYISLFFAFVISALMGSILRLVSVKIVPKIFDMREILSYSLPSLLAGLGMSLINSGNISALGLFSGATQAGIFTVAFILSGLLRMVPTNIYGGIAPSVSFFWEKRMVGNVKSIVKRALKYSLLISLPFAFIVSSYSQELISLFSGPGYTEASKIILPLSLGFVVLGVYTIISGSLYMTGRPIAYGLISFFGGSLNFFLTAVFSSYEVYAASASFLFSVSLMTILAGFFLWKNLGYFIGRETILITVFGLSMFSLISIPVVGLVLYTLLVTTVFDRTDEKIILDVKRKAGRFGFLIEPMVAFVRISLRIRERSPFFQRRRTKCT
ncbi:MAG: oligosaccharide flippase family protein [Candidatus Micrarchaeota archaeon]|nr:oligosaccharide flippase family protein [Candidatus Micrarchaeota archaeon]